MRVPAACWRRMRGEADVRRFCSRRGDPPASPRVCPLRADHSYHAAAGASPSSRGGIASRTVLRFRNSAAAAPAARYSASSSNRHLEKVASARSGGGGDHAGAGCAPKVTGAAADAVGKLGWKAAGRAAGVAEPAALLRAEDDATASEAEKGGAAAAAGPAPPGAAKAARLVKKVVRRRKIPSSGPTLEAAGEARPTPAYPELPGGQYPSGAGGAGDDTGSE